MAPIIGITADNRHNTADSGTYESAISYSRAVADAGALPVLLPHEPQRAREYVERCDGLILSGGVDPDTTPFGASLHPKARRMDPRRQAFELALLDASVARQRQAVLGVCLGMQLMALQAGGRLNQYLPDTLDCAAVHQDNRRHGLVFVARDSVLQPGEGPVCSSHRQAVDDPGSMRIVATAPDGTIEAIDQPDRDFYLGVQWHPERGPWDDDVPGVSRFSRELIRFFVDAARSAR